MTARHLKQKKPDRVLARGRLRNLHVVRHRLTVHGQLCADQSGPTRDGPGRQ